MNTEQITTLQKLLSEIDNSMTRADAEKDLQAEITLRAARECGVNKKDFAALAKAHHKGDMHIARQRCIDQADLFEMILGSDDLEASKPEWSLTDSRGNEILNSSRVAGH